MRIAIIVILSLFSLILVGHVVWRYVKGGKMPPTEETLTLVTVLLAIIAILAVVPQNGPTIAAEPTQTLPTPLPTTAPTTVMPTDASTSEPTGTPTETATPTPPPTPTNTNTPSPTSTPTWTATPSPTATATPTPTLGVGSMRISEKDGMTELYVPAGRFLMGAKDSDAHNDDDEKPQHEVYLDAYWIDQTEVTNSQYVSFLNELGGYQGKCDGEDCVVTLDDGNSDSHILRQGAEHVVEKDFADHPVVNVTWYGANAYCAWVGRKLPTEAQWEKAARKEDGRIYPWGDESPTCDLANYSGCVGGPSPVGSYPDGASSYGALDMSGNVWEWVADWYDSSYYQNSLLRNPFGPDEGSRKVLRGGSWLNYDYGVRASNRGRNTPPEHYNDVGFRCVQE